MYELKEICPNCGMVVTLKVSITNVSGEHLCKYCKKVAKFVVILHLIWEMDINCN